MKRAVLAALAVILVFTGFSSLEAKDKKTQRPIFYRPDYGEVDLDIPGYEAMMSLAPAAAADTYRVVWYDFETADWQGWTQVDNTVAPDTFFHVDDFAGLGGGSWGRLVPLEGTKSVWCGVRPNSGPSLFTCNWAAAPGYGNDWDEFFSAAIPHDPGDTINVSYRLACDTESGRDLVTFEYSTDVACCYWCCRYCDWEVLDTYSGVVDTVVSHELFSIKWGTKLRFRFQSDGAWSDEDGYIDTDGACMIDSITIWDNERIIDYEDFENYSVGESECGWWTACVNYAYGAYGGLAAGLESRDPCGFNSSSLIMFFNGSSFPSEDYPGLYDTPFCTGTGGVENPCQDEMIVSPPIDLTRYSAMHDGSQELTIAPGDLSILGGIYLKYNAYVDLPVNNLVFRTWRIRNLGGSCPGKWRTEGIWVPYEPSRAWITATEDISALVTSDSIQVALGVIDMCGAWYGTYGDCEEHTPAPWYDDVRILRFGTGGPAWNVRRAELFQDTFPQEVYASTDPMEEICRADMAVDVAPGNEFTRIDPGDSAVVRVAAPMAGGLDTLATGEARVYCHVNVTYIGNTSYPKPDLFGPQLEGDYGSYVSDDGDWTALLCEPAHSSAGVIALNAYCIDLNDSLFTRGYMIEYYFKAYSQAGSSGTYPANAESMPPSPFFGTSRLLEFTCLPTLRIVPALLYVDDYDGRGTFDGTVQTYFDYTFWDMLWGTDEIPDRYDVNGPSSALSNGIGAYTSVTDASSIFCIAYEIVLFDSGDLNSCTVSEGTENSDKSNDAQLLIDWMNVSEHKVGLLMMGDHAASDLATSQTAVALELVSTICGVTLASGSYLEMTGGVNKGGIVSPMITGVGGYSPFGGLSYFAFGGCPYINNFDVLETTGPGEYALAYPAHNDLSYYAGICTDQLNNASQSLRTVWVGHSFQYIRNASAYGLPRNEFFRNFMNFCGNTLWYVPMDAELPKATALSQNFPNPFNPVTRLKYSLKEKGHVSMRVYDVSGRLVRVLVDEILDAGTYEAVWDGTNDRGSSIASGIYFCRMEASDYERTLKMVMLR